MNEILDPGHKYKLLSLDGQLEQVLTFVKRCDLEHPDKFPGNTDAYPGTTMQAVIRVVLNRLAYVDNQHQHDNNKAVAARLLECLWLLEDRAAERHGYSFDFRVEDMMQMPMCAHCGHVVCPELGNAHR